MTLRHKLKLNKLYETWKSKIISIMPNHILRHFKRKHSKKLIPLLTQVLTADTLTVPVWTTLASCMTDITAADEACCRGVLVACAFTKFNIIFFWSAFFLLKTIGKNMYYTHIVLGETNFATEN